MRIYVVGGGGYIGSRLVKRLRKHHEVEVIDIGIFNNVEDPRDAMLMPPPKNQDPVIWLASIHDLPEAIEQNEMVRNPWFTYAYGLMINRPREWVQAGHPMIYVSSMRSLTEDTVYAQVKREGECLVIGNPRVQVFRFGTVWGGFEDPTFPMRHQTAMNNFLIHHDVPENYSRFTTHMDFGLSMLVQTVNRIGSPLRRAIREALRGGDLAFGEIINVTDFSAPTMTERLENLLTDEPCSFFESRILAERDYISEFGVNLQTPHPMEKLAKITGLPWPEKNE